MGDVTAILSALDRGEPKAAEDLLPLVYDELRRIAAHKLVGEKPGQTLQAPALVHEAYLRSDLPFRVSLHGTGEARSDHGYRISGMG